MNNKNVIFIIICLLAGAAFLSAQESPRHEGLFVEASGLLYFPPLLLEDYIEPGFGFRGALGYEYQRFRFAIESGYSHFAGTDSIIAEMGFAPLVFKFGYALPLFSIVGLQADVSAGVVFSNVMRYPNMIDLDINKIQEDRENHFITGGRLYATIAPHHSLRIYAGGGADIIFENDGPLPLPLVEVGIHFKPFAKKKSGTEQDDAAEAARRKALAEEINAVIEEQEITGVAAEATDEGVMIRLSNIQFLPDSAELHDSEKEKLQEIANILRDIPGIRIQVEGHTALAGTARRRQVFSHERAQAVASHLISLGAVEADDVTVIGHGAERPIADNATEEGMAINRRVEIIILEKVETTILKNNDEIIIEETIIEEIIFEEIIILESEG